jgi:hypothetical protein
MVPVNFTSGPLNGTLAVGGKSSGPERELDAGWCLWIVIDASGLVEGVFAVDGAADLVVDFELDAFRGPVKFVGVPVVKGRGTNTNVGCLCIYTDC